MMQREGSSPTYHDSTGAMKRRWVMKSDGMWFYPPESLGNVSGTVPSLLSESYPCLAARWGMEILPEVSSW